MRHRLSLRGSVGPSVRPSVGPSVRPSVRYASSNITQMTHLVAQSGLFIGNKWFDSLRGRLDLIPRRLDNGVWMSEKIKQKTTSTKKNNSKQNNNNGPAIRKITTNSHVKVVEFLSYTNKDGCRWLEKKKHGLEKCRDPTIRSFDRVLRDSISHFLVGPSIRRLVGRSPNCFKGFLKRFLCLNGRKEAFRSK